MRTGQYPQFFQASSLVRNILNIFGRELTIESEKIESIQLSKSGKFEWIISEVSKDFLKNGVKDI